MAMSLLEGLNGLVTPDLLSTAARSLGESEGAVAAGFGAALPTLLAGLTAKAARGSAIRPLFDIIRSPINDASVVSNPRLAATTSPGSPLGGLGERLLDAVFGEDLPSVGNAISRTAGLRPDSGETILAMATPLVLGLLGSRVRTGGLSAEGLSNLLLGERDQIASAVPAGLEPLLRRGTASDRVRPPASAGDRDAEATAKARHHSAAEKPEKQGHQWLWPTLAVVAFAAVAWTYFQGRPHADDQIVGAVTGAAEDAREQLGAGGGDIRFTCGGQAVTLGQTGDRMVLETHSGHFDMHRVDAKSGSRYVSVADTGTSFWTRGDKAELVVGGRKYPECSRNP